MLIFTLKYLNKIKSQLVFFFED